jgi:hypothetical protein
MGDGGLFGETGPQNINFTICGDIQKVWVLGEEKKRQTIYEKKKWAKWSTNALLVGRDEAGNC